VMRTARAVDENADRGNGPCRCGADGTGVIEIASGHDGTNNGRLGLSVRRASERCNITRYGATCFGRNQDGGFVDCMTNGAFQPEGTARRAKVPIAVSIEGTHIVYHRA